MDGLGQPGLFIIQTTRTQDDLGSAREQQFLGAEIRRNRTETSTQINYQTNKLQLKPKVTNMNIDNFPEIDFESLPLCEEALRA